MHKVLIANRGEIAYRLILACRARQLKTVAVFAPVDEAAPFVRLADEAYALAGDTPAQSYLDAAQLLRIAHDSQADAVHPGYGFLSESAEFAAQVINAGLVWIGPPAEAIVRLGNKWQARELARQNNIPVLPGGLLDTSPDQFPVMIKASDGGGGLGLRRVDRAEDLEAAITEARTQCAGAFRIAPEAVNLYWEAYLPGARHLEVQIAVDHSGQAVHYGIRECSVQRRFQKIIEECPIQADIGSLAVQLAQVVGYRNLGTVEFLWTPEDGPRFLEMNTRLQVEHPVTELVYGIDLPQLQLAIAAGESLPVCTPRGHAIEARIYAEDPNTGAPVAGRIDHLRWPMGPWIRVDAGVEEGQSLPTDFDALLAKIVAWGPDRKIAIAQLADALSRTEIAGTLSTNLAQLRAVLVSEAFLAGNFTTGQMADQELMLAQPHAHLAAAAVGAVIREESHKRPGPRPPQPEAPSNTWARRPWR